MTTLLITLAVQAVLLWAVRFAPKKVRYWLAKRIRLYANYCSPDAF